MPTYRYRCAKCGDEIEEWQSFDDEPLVKHRGCGGKLAKVLSTPGIVLKGSGFYRTDNRNGASTSSKRSSTTDTSDSGTSDSGTSDSGTSDSGTSDSDSRSSSATGDKGRGSTSSTTTKKTDTSK